LLKNEADMPLPTFMGGYPIPHPNWENGVAQTDFPRMQPLLEFVQGLLQKGLTGKEILWTFLSHEVNPLRQQEVVVKVPLAPGCLVPPPFPDQVALRQTPGCKGLWLPRIQLGKRPIVPVVTSCGCNG
jgi:hypothetical protein